VSRVSEAGIREPGPAHDADDEGLQFTPRRLLGIVAFLILAIVALYYLAPRLAGLEQTWHRMESGDPYWLLLAVAFTVGSFAGYVGLFRGVFVRAGAQLGWRESYQITMSGMMAARLFGAGGAGGIVLTAWALRRSGMAAREVADKSVSFLVLTYAVYAAALVVCGLGLQFEVLPGPAPFGVTVAPALMGLAAVAGALIVAVVPTDFQEWVAERRWGEGRLARWGRRLANIPAAASAGVRDAIGHLGRRDPALVGALAYWGFQIAVLWAAFRALGEAPPLAVLVMGFFVGMFGNLLPLPGGVGGVEGGMVAAFAAFGVEPGLALVAVLIYRAFVFWLPMVPGVAAYFQLLHTVDRWRDEQRSRQAADARLVRPTA
jgi:uncharacterized membrane protein YbhN (UPF0104 family)